MTLSLVTVTHNSRKDVRRYVDSFLKMHAKAGDSPSIEFVFVENSGDDGISAALTPLREAGYPVQFLTMENKGFGAGCNLGARHAVNDVLVFANPDIEFLSPIYEVSRLAGSWGTVLQLNRAGAPQSFDVLPEAKTVFGELHGRYRNVTPPTDEWLDRLVPVGSFFCVDRSIFLEEHGFNERFFLYHEEAELSRRLHRRLGPPVLIEDVSILHRAFGSQTDPTTTNKHELDGLFTYVDITGAKRPLRTRFLLLALTSPLRRTSRERLVQFARRIWH